MSHGDVRFEVIIDLTYLNNNEILNMKSLVKENIVELNNKLLESESILNENYNIFEKTIISLNVQ